MRRLLAIVTFVMLSMVPGALVLAASTAQTGPQDTGIPGAEVNISAQTLAPNGMANSVLYEITLAAGTEVGEHEHLGAVAWYVDSGTVTFTLLEGEAWGRCAGGCRYEVGEPQIVTPAGDELLPIGVDITFEAGDWIIQNDYTVHSFWAGEEDVVIVASTTYSEEQANRETDYTGPSLASPVADTTELEFHHGGSHGPSPERCAGGCL